MLGMLIGVARQRSGTTHLNSSNKCSHLQPEPIGQLDHEDMGAIGVEGAAEIPQRCEDAGPCLVDGRHVPDEKKRATAHILPPQDDVAAERLAVEVGIERDGRGHELKRAGTRQPSDVGVVAHDDERLPDIPLQP